jgi:hypothetical protein
MCMWETVILLQSGFKPPHPRLRLSFIRVVSGWGNQDSSPLGRKQLIPIRSVLVLARFDGFSESG